MRSTKLSLLDIGTASRAQVDAVARTRAASRPPEPPPLQRRTVLGALALGVFSGMTGCGGGGSAGAVFPSAFPPPPSPPPPPPSSPPPSAPPPAAAYAWQDSARLADLGGASVGDSLQLAAAGDSATAVWLQTERGNPRVWASRYTVVAGWSAPVRLSSEDEVIAVQVRVAQDAQGRAVAIWRHGNTVGTQRLWAARFDRDAGWSAPAVINTRATAIGLADLGIDAEGRALALWTELEQEGQAFGAQTLWCATQAVGAAWQPPQPVHGDALPDMREMRLVQHPSGRALLLATQQEEEAKRLHAASYSAELGWGALLPVAAMPSRAELAVLEAGVDAAGGALALWSAYGSDTGADLWQARLPAGAAAWGVPTLIEEEAASVDEARLALAEDGSAIALWSARDDDNNARLVARRCDTAGVWDPPVFIDADTAGGSHTEASHPVLAQGTVDTTAVWSQWNGNGRDIKARSLQADGHWGEAVRVDDGEHVPRAPCVAAGASFTLAAWARNRESGGGQDLWFKVRR